MVRSFFNKHDRDIMMRTKNNSSFLTLGLVLATIGLAACSGGAQKAPPVTSTTMNPNLKSAAIDRATEKAIAQANANGNAQEALALLAQVHSRNPEDAIVATRYARALREDDQISAAIRTLSPYVKGDNKNIEAVTEMAMAQIAVGDFKAAEDFASIAIEENSKNARAYLALGTAQDALGRHQDAEISFRQGLKNWKGDSTPILNNLALNLASQGHLEESLSLLEKALAISPNRMDLERNRRIIATLVETSGPRAPTPNEKPEVETENTAPAEEQSAVVPPKKPVSKPQEITAEDINKNNVDKQKHASQTKIDVQQDAIEEVKAEVETVKNKTTISNLKSRSGGTINE